MLTAISCKNVAKDADSDKDFFFTTMIYQRMFKNAVA